MATLQVNAGQLVVNVSGMPDFCPICNVGVSADFVVAYTCSTNFEIDALYVCPKSNCKKMFIATYKRNHLNSSYDIESLLPRTFEKAALVKEVVEISPQFGEIFSQATQAEAYGLGEIAGVGYRKSLEYLIKDYCTAQQPEKEEDIKKRPIAQVIEAFVSNENVKQCAKRAIWLGNDETHYVRKWEGKDVKDLKLLIQITVNWIQQEVITKKLLEDMQ